jgi:hypothetical protein
MRCENSALVFRQAESQILEFGDRDHGASLMHRHGRASLDALAPTRGAPRVPRHTIRPLPSFAEVARGYIPAQRESRFVPATKRAPGGGRAARVCTMPPPTSAPTARRRRS